MHRPKTKIAFATLLAAIAVACADKRNDCEWLANCPDGRAGTGITAGTHRGGNAGTSTKGGAANDGGTSGYGAVVGTAGNAGTIAAAGNGTAGNATAGTAGAAGALSIPCKTACSGATPYCDESAGLCVACLKDTDCPSTAPVCDTEADACVACTKDSHCGGAAPACDTKAHVCVPCTADKHCPTTLPACNSNATCVACTANTHCSGAKPACNTTTSLCVECVANSDCTNVAGKPVCDTGTNVCVECLSNDTCKDSAKPQCNTATKACVACLSNADCKTAGASRCDVTAGSATVNTCLPCSISDDCSQIVGKSVCLAGTGTQPSQCVQCTPANETACGANSCNPKTSACSATERGSRDLCNSCIADSECIGGNVATPTVRCVPMTFNGTAHGEGGYCLQTVSSAGASGCTRPYTIPFAAISLSGAASVDYCGINQTVTSCEAILDLFDSKVCGADNECGGGSGGLCRTVGTNPNRCTIPCSLGSECPTALTCSSTANGYCR